MVIGQLSAFFQQQHQVGMTDGELLECFIAERDEASFTSLVERHGPMVLGVSRRIVGNAMDAEDVFQATFLVLVRKAASVVPREAVGNWLYGVAYRTALEARACAVRRRAKEKQVTDMPDPPTEAQSDHRELRALLDRELNRLPDKYRLPVVLCEMEGRSRKEVARQLRIPEGTLSSRLASARKMLARRLARHATSLTTGAITLLLSQARASVQLPQALMKTTIQAAVHCAAGDIVAVELVSAKVATLTEGVIRDMFLTKLKFVSACLMAIGLTCIGTGMFALSSATAADGKDVKAAKTAEQPASQNVTAVKENQPAQSQKDDEQKNQKDDGQKNQKDDGQKNQKDDGQANQKDDSQKQEGVIKEVDPVKNSVTILVKKQGKEEQLFFAFPKEIPVTVDGKASTPAKLKPGMKVGLDLSKDKKEVVRIREVPVKVVNKVQDEPNKDNGQQNQKDDGQKNQKDDGQKNQNDDGQKNQNSGEGQKNQKSSDQ